MNCVEPIKNIDVFHAIQDSVKKENQRNYIMIMFGIYTAFRISDILKFKIKDVKNKNVIHTRDIKTGKENTVEINPVLKTELKWYCEGKGDEEYLFLSQQGINKPIGRVRAWQIMKDIQKEFNTDNLGTHSLRKSFGYHYYKKTGDIATLMTIFNHSKESMTLKYIGITQDKKNKALREFRM